jgi:transposase InsO family protein
MTGRPPSPPPRSTTRQRSLPRTTVDDHAASLAVDRVNASEDAAHDQPHDACLLPSQPLSLEVLRRPLDFAQYTAGAYQAVLTAHGIRCSMSRKGDCLDNAMAESFFATLKRELMPTQGWTTKAAARAAVFEWIAVYYNRQRRHSSIGYLPPVEFEASKELHQAA